MELKNFDNIISRVPALDRPLRVILAGSDGENMLQGLFQAQREGIVQPVLVGGPDHGAAGETGAGEGALHHGGHPSGAQRDPGRH